MLVFIEPGIMKTIRALQAFKEFFALNVAKYNFKSRKIDPKLTINKLENMLLFLLI